LGIVTSRKAINYEYVDIVPTTKSVNPNVGFDIPNTLSGTYDIYLVTCPIWLMSSREYVSGSNFYTINFDSVDVRPYRFYSSIYERENEGKNLGEYPSSGKRMKNPATGEEVIETRGFVRDEEGHVVINDTTYLGSWTFKNAYYGRNDEGVILQLQTVITSKQTHEYSREMLISSIILKPREDGGEEIEIPAAGGEANMRKGIQSITSNTRK
jgi:hypothetical protein